MKKLGSLYKLVVYKKATKDRNQKLLEQAVRALQYGGDNIHQNKYLEIFSETLLAFEVNPKEFIEQAIEQRRGFDGGNPGEGGPEQ